MALAAAIKQAMGQGGSVAVVDPGAPTAGSPRPLRTVAIAEGPRRLLEHVGAWETIEPKAQPILSMAIMDGDVRDVVRLPHLNFAAKDRAPLAHMAFNDDVVGALSALCDRLGVQRVTAPSRIGLRASASPRSGFPTAAYCARGSQSPPTARARNCAALPTSDHRLGL